MSTLIRMSKAEREVLVKILQVVLSDENYELLPDFWRPGDAALARDLLKRLSGNSGLAAADPWERDDD